MGKLDLFVNGLVHTRPFKCLHFMVSRGRATTAHALGIRKGQLRALGNAKSGQHDGDPEHDEGEQNRHPLDGVAA